MKYVLSVEVNQVNGDESVYIFPFCVIDIVTVVALQNTVTVEQDNVFFLV